MSGSREICAMFEFKALGIGPGFDSRLNGSKSAIVQSHKPKDVLRIIVWSTELYSQIVSASIEIVGLINE
jgi:hypothetical protein